MNESELNRTAALAGVATVDLGGPGAGQCLRNGTADGREDRPVEDDHGCPGMSMRPRGDASCCACRRPTPSNGSPRPRGGRPKPDGTVAALPGFNRPGNPAGR